MGNDSKLKKAVLEELSWEPSVTAAHIGVAAHDGVITLSGHVGSYAEKHAAEVAAGRVKGVRAVAEEIEVQLPSQTTRTDEEIAAAAIQRMMWDSSIPDDAVKVKVEKGWVTLSGEVHWFFQKEAALHDVRGLWGVIGVSDQVTVRPHLDTSSIQTAIIAALGRSWFFDPDTVTVHAHGGKVRLGGTARSMNEERIALSTAWATPGVTSVESDIHVG
jgi:osmotically-inducible protein OsmY